MSLVRDIQSKLAVKPLAALTEFAIGVQATNESDAIDTKGFHALTVSLATDRALAAADVFTYTFEESDDGSTGWTEVAENAVLPYRKEPGRTMVIAQNDFVQTIGVFSTKQYVRVSITGTADTTALNITPTAILEAQVQEFTGYDAAGAPNDGLP